MALRSASRWLGGNVGSSSIDAKGDNGSLLVS
jgi:hypothetical protein